MREQKKTIRATSRCYRVVVLFLRSFARDLLQILICKITNTRNSMLIRRIFFCNDFLLESVSMGVVH